MPVAALVESKEALRIPMMDLRDFRSGEPNQCRYIADEPPGPDYIACGRETSAGASYCSHCLKIVKRNPRAEFSEAEAMKRRARFIAIGRSTFGWFRAGRCGVMAEQLSFDDYVPPARQ
jgi:hypothetical protein